MSVPLSVLYLNALPGPVREMKLRGVRRYAAIHGWRVDVIPIGDSSPDGVRALLRDRRPDGCIIDCSGRKGFPGIRLFGATPAVWLDLPDGDRTAAARRAVLVDNEAIAAAALRELKAVRPAALAVVSSPFYARWARFRAASFSALATAAGLPCPHFAAHRGEEPAVRATRLARWLAGLPRPCGVFAVNDIVAGHVQRACLAAGLHIPREIALVGVDNIAMRSAVPDASITSIRLDFERMGYVAARMLWELMDSRTSGTLREVKTSAIGPLMVVRRKSTCGRGRHEPWIDEALEAIRSEACDGLTAARLAARYPGSRRLFEMRFREATGHSILDEILHVRLEKAFELLSRADTAIGAIPYLCGFSSGRALDYLFRSRFKMSMRQWRKEHALPPST